jgi:hypothetical protein
MAHTTKADRKSPAERRQERLAAELRSNLRKRKQQARGRAARADAAAGSDDGRGVPEEPGRREGT